jgi:hypothetical protein
MATKQKNYKYSIAVGFNKRHIKCYRNVFNMKKGEKIMKKIIGVAITSILLTGTAMANAGPMACATCAEVPIIKWAGLKFGVTGGYGHTFGKFNSNGQVLGVARNNNITVSPHSWAGGPVVGYFYQATPHVLLGLEASYTFAGMKARARIHENGILSTNFKTKNLGSLGVVPTIGFTSGDAKAYIGFGWAYGQWKSTDNCAIGRFFNRVEYKSAFRTVLGAAMKVPKVPGGSIGVEAVYDFYGKQSQRFTQQNVLGLVDLNNNYKPGVLSFLAKLTFDVNFM